MYKKLRKAKNIAIEEMLLETDDIEWNKSILVKKIKNKIFKINFKKILIG